MFFHSILLLTMKLFPSSFCPARALLERKEINCRISLPGRRQAPFGSCLRPRNFDLPPNPFSSLFLRLSLSLPSPSPQRALDKPCLLSSTLGPRLISKSRPSPLSSPPHSLLLSPPLPSLSLDGHGRRPHSACQQASVSTLALFPTLLGRG